MTHRFVRSSYWGKWSLVLTTRYVGERQRILARLTGQTPGHSTIEVDLEPVNGWNRCGGEALERMRRINVRRHCTARDPKDVFADQLPMAAETALAAHLGPELTGWLLHPETEILGLIDWSRYETLCNGGAGLLDCAHARHVHLIPGVRASESFGRIADALARGELRAA